MWCYIFDGKSLAPYSGDFRRRTRQRQACGQDQEIEACFFYSKMLSRRLSRPRPEFRGGVGYPREFSIFSDINCEAGLQAGVHHYKSDSNFFSSPYLLMKHHGDVCSTGKRCVQSSAITGIFFIIKHKINIGGMLN